MKLLLLAVLLILPAGAANWERYVYTGKGDHTTIAEPRPLSYFTQYPSLRDEERVLCYRCPPEKLLALAKREKLKEKQRTEVRPVGKIHGFEIYDVFYYFSRPWQNGEETLDWKAILVRTGPDQYREIWHYQKTEGDIWPSYLFHVGDEFLLGLSDDCYRQNVVKQHWRFAEDGPSRIVIDPVWKAAMAVLPKDHSIYPVYDGRTALWEGVIEVGMFKGGQSNFPVPGVIKVSFTLNHGQIVIIGTEYDATAEWKSTWGCG